ncbi:hypothetical protein C1H46_024690 [Malus baccata]|uniref:J domain-containing protein n=1 Tax=Malus baccata TaxID=106549 RepID=A0A540LTG1_MALBA|nr:hypothetical protein C1H46_024690 [Malus baccata]
MGIRESLPSRVISERTIGPAMPSAELLAAAAKLTKAQAELREAELEEDSEYFIGPPPPAVVAETESANEAERYWKMSLLVHPDKCSHPQAHQAFVKLNKAFNESTIEEIEFCEEVEKEMARESSKKGAMLPPRPPMR